MKIERHSKKGCQLDPGEVDEVWLFFKDYVDRPRDAFIAKLLTVSTVVLFRDTATQSLCGFLAYDDLTVRWRDRPVSVIYTHWGTIAPTLRGSYLGQIEVLYFYLRVRAQHPRRRLYWVFSASTYLSYMVMVRYPAEGWPRRDQPWPEREAHILNEVMALESPTGWDPVARVIRRHGSSRYREGVVADRPEVMADPDIRYYAELNPGQAQGDSLLCMARVSAKNWAHASLHLLGKLMHQYISRQRS